MASFGQGVLLLLLSSLAHVLVHAGKYCCDLLSPSECLCLETQAILCHWQTWNWTASPVMWRWCGPRAGPWLTLHSSVWVTASPPATHPGRLSSARVSIAVTSGGWCVKIWPAGSAVFSMVLPPCLSLALSGYWGSLAVHQWSDLHFLWPIPHSALQSSSCLCIWEVGTLLLEH